MGSQVQSEAGDAGKFLPRKSAVISVSSQFRLPALGPCRCTPYSWPYLTGREAVPCDRPEDADSLVGCSHETDAGTHCDECGAEMGQVSTRSTVAIAFYLRQLGRQLRRMWRQSNSAFRSTLS